MTSIHQILFPTDLSERADRALDHARFMAERFGASLTLYHAVEVPDHRYAHWAFAHNHEIWAEAEKQARHCLERRAETLGVSHRIVVERKPSIPGGVLEKIQSLQPDLTVMATHGRDGLSHMIMGSVTEKVVQHAFRPILCVREPDHARALPYRRILVPTDFSLASRLAFPMAVFLARSFRAEVLALHVVPSPTLTTLSDIPQPRPTVIHSEASLWKFFQPEFSDLEVTAQVHVGSVWSQIGETARIEKADLIVMSTRGHDSLADRLLGSNTERVVRHAPCPVLVA